MDSERSRWTRWLLRIGAFRASEAELGDIMEELSTGRPRPRWVARQILSTLRRPRSRATPRERGGEMLSNIWRDIRYALRTLRRYPGFAAAAIAPIALGVGLNTGVFSILSNVAFAAVPAVNPGELVSIYQEFSGVKGRQVHGARVMFSAPEYRAYRDGTRTLSGVLAYSKTWTATLGDQSPQEIDGAVVSCTYFDVLQVRPSIGTGFTRANCDEPGAPPVVILSHALWTRAFNADPAITSRTVLLNGRDVGVAGVAPEGFDGIDVTRAAFFAPMSLQPLLHVARDFRDDPQISWLTLIGRRAPGIGIDQARAELAVIAGRIDREQPGRRTQLIVEPATPLSLPVMRVGFLSAAAVVQLAFALILLIACANVANVLLARAAVRSREIAVRVSVGAGRGRLMQQLLTESAVIAVLGGAAGSLLALWSSASLLPLVLASLPGGLEAPRVAAHPSPMALWFAIGVTCVTALLCGLVPAFQGSKHDLHGIAKQATGDSGGRFRGWLHAALISSQVALCMVLLISSGLLLRALYAAHTLDPGFDHRHVTLVSIDLRGPSYDDARAAAFREQFIDRLAALTGVEAVARVARVPFSPGRSQTSFRLPHSDTSYEADVNSVSSEYFSLLRIPIVRGRAFTADEAAGSRAVIVTEATARRYWPGHDPVGRTIVMGQRSLEIVGVARDAQVSHLAGVGSSYIYLPAGQQAERRLSLLVRSQTDFAALASSVRALTRATDPGLVVRVSRFDNQLEYWRAGSRLVASLSGSLSALALLLASVGVYGVVAYAVSRRMREVGIRVALGAGAPEVRRLILTQTLRPVVAGAIVGVGAAGVASQMLRSALFGISPFDPPAYAGAALMLLVVALAASLVPLRQAVNVDPLIALRRDA